MNTPVSQYTDADIMEEVLNYFNAPEIVREYLQWNDGKIFKSIMSPSISSLKLLQQTEQRTIRCLAELYKRMKIEEKELLGQKPEFVRSSADLVGHIMPYMEEAPGQEHLIVVDLAPNMKVVGTRRVGLGTDSQVITSMGLLFKDSIINCAHSMAVAHNHPSGSLTPSDADISTMKAIKAAGKLLDIPLQDMLIVVDDGRFRSVMNSQ